jgi:pantoate--beta-alanine ligase
VEVVDTIEGLRAARHGLKGRVGVVLTMGALHAGHLVLVEQAREENDSVLATIFVNPLQFAAGEDLDKYPRDLPHDLALFETAGVDVVFTPTPALMYPTGFQTSVIVRDVTRGLEGDRRPNHFQGVATVVAKLFNLTQPDITYFGQKDAQQVIVIKRMTRDLNFPLQIAVLPTIRETNGLAMSSRNAYLTVEQRDQAGTIYRGLCAAANLYERGEHDPQNLIGAARAALDDSFVEDYISLNDPMNLTPIKTITDAPMLLSIAVQMGTTHLIDNCLLPFELNNLIDLSRILGGD